MLPCCCCVSAIPSRWLLLFNIKLMRFPFSSISSSSLLLAKIPFMYIPLNDICFAYLHKMYPTYLYVSQVPMFYSCVSLSFAFHILCHLNHIKCQKEWSDLLVYGTYNSVCSSCGREIIRLPQYIGPQFTRAILFDCLWKEVIKKKKKRLNITALT